MTDQIPSESSRSCRCWLVEPAVSEWMLDAGVRCWESEPRAYDPLDRPKLCARKSSQCADQFGVRNRDEVLCVEYASPKERKPDRHFESGIARTCRVRNKGNESAIAIIGWHADSHCRPDLGSHPKIDQPDFSPLRGFHCDCSCRSSSTNRISAATTRSSSWGTSCVVNAVRRSSSTTSSARSSSGRASTSSSSFKIACVIGSDCHLMS